MISSDILTIRIINIKSSECCVDVGWAPYGFFRPCYNFFLDIIFKHFNTSIYITHTYNSFNRDYLMMVLLYFSWRKWERNQNTFSIYYQILKFTMSARGGEIRVDRIARRLPGRMPEWMKMRNEDIIWGWIGRVGVDQKLHQINKKKINKDVYAYWRQVERRMEDVERKGRKEIGKVKIVKKSWNIE